ncbi:MAG: hypothetical protein E7288_01610 [Lachnospiraceae bacterium]|nr:hypothetical protein [Lachnospiraceae bacterium]
MKRKNTVIGIVMLIMLLFTACGEEKPLAERVIENLEDCMGAREMTEEEYAGMKKKTRINPVYYFQSLRTDNTYLICKESDLPEVNIGLSFMADEELEVTNAIMYRYDNWVENDITYMEVAMYEFVSNEQAEIYMEYLEDVGEAYYLTVKENKIAQGIYPDDRKLGIEEGENYIYQVVSSEMNGKSNDSIYFYKADRQVMEVHYNGYEDNELYPKLKKFLKKMKFEGLNDIKLEYAEPQSGDA